MSSESSNLESRPIKKATRRTKIYDVNNVKPVSIPWLNLTSVYPPRNVNEKGLFTKLNEPYNESLWNLIQYSMPPFLDSKYHNINITELSENPLNDILCSTTYVMWNETMGHPLLNLLKIKHTKYEEAKLENDESLNKWKVEVDEIIKYLKMTRTEFDFKYTTTRQETKVDLCTKASEFLLEPCILIQLPWKPVLFYQWLTAALVQVLIIEKETIEFRHWAYSNEAGKLLCLFLSLLRSLKSFIVVGFNALSRQLDRYNKRIGGPVNMHPFIFEVVRIVNNLFEFFLSETSHDIVNLVKKNPVLNEEIEGSTTVTRYLGKDAYDQFDKLYNLPYIFNNWTNGNIPSLFPIETSTSKNSGPSGQAEFTEETTKELNIDEKYLFQILQQRTETSKLGNKQRCELTIKVIKEKIIDAGILPEINIADVRKIFRSSKAKQLASEIFNEEITENIHKAILQAMMYDQAYNLLVEAETENSVMAQIIRLQIEILEKEQIARLINTCRLMFNIIPKTTLLDTAATIKLLQMCRELTAARESVAVEDPSIFWSKFPEEWRKPVSRKEKIPNLYSNFDDRITSFEDRIKRLVYNIGKETFNVCEKGGDIFSGWTVVQYVLPCLVAKYKQENEKYNLNNLKFIHGMIQMYENSYNSWVTQSNTKNVTEVSLDISTDNQKIFWCFLVSQYVYHVSDALGTENIITIFVQKTNEWLYFLRATEGIDLDFVQTVVKFYEFVYKFAESVLDMYNKINNLPKAGTVIPLYPELGELYFACSIISDMQLLYNIEQVILYNSGSEKIKDFKVIAISNVSRTSLPKIVNKLLTLNEKTDQIELSEFLEKYKTILLKYYKKLQDFRKQNVQHNFSTEILPLIKLLPCSKSNTKVQDAVKCYLTGNFTALENLLTILFPRNTELVDKKCRNCSLLETTTTKFLVCKKCIEEKYPDVNYFCGISCQEQWWKTEHMAEHLEFELGIGDFAELSVNK